MIWIVLFFNDTATTEIYTLSLHDALPISATSRLQVTGTDRSAAGSRRVRKTVAAPRRDSWATCPSTQTSDRKSTRLNSSHANISYAVFCLKKKITFPPLHRIHSASPCPPL